MTGLSITTALSGFIKPPSPTVTPSAGVLPADDVCCLASQSLSTHLTDEPGPCLTTSGTPALIIENERENSVTTTVDLSGGKDLSKTYNLAPGERIVEPDAFGIVANITGTVTIDGEMWQVHWPDPSCCRPAIALTPDDPTIGWVEPLSGIPDMRQGAYPGSPTLLRLEAEDRARTITVTVTNQCEEMSVTKTVDLPAGQVKLLDGGLVSGGKFDIMVDIEDGTTVTYTYDEAWGGVNVAVSADGTVAFRRFAM